MTFLRALLLAIALPAAAAPAQFQVVSFAYHGVSHAQHQTHANTLGPQGYRMISLTVAGGWASAHYSAVWVQQSGPAWVAGHGMTEAQYLAARTTWEGQGYRAKIVTASGSGTDKVYAAVYVADGASVDAPINLSKASFESWVDSRRDNDRRLVSVAVYGTAANPLYAAVFEPDTTDFGWGQVTSSDGVEYQDHFDEYTAMDATPSALATSEAGAYVSVWRDIRVGAFTAVHDRTSLQFSLDRIAASNAGLVPLCIAARGSGGNARFAGVFVQRLTPMPRTMARTGTALPEMQTVDDWVETWMTNHQVRNAALAVTRNGKLVHARGFTFAEAGHPLTQPTSMFRLGSISKAITGMLAHQVIQSGASLSLGTGYVNHMGITTYSQNALGVTVQRLLNHTAGLNEPPLDQVQIAQWATTANPPVPLTLPPAEHTVGRYTIQNGITEQGKYSYSNAGATMLGSMIEQTTGQTLLQALHLRVLSPLGVTRVVRQQARRSDLAPTEVPYFPLDLDLAAGNLDANGALMAPQYNDQFWLGGGGLTSTAVDLARIVAGSFQIGSDSPVFTAQTQANMLVQRAPFVRGSTTNTAQITDSAWHWDVDGQGRTIWQHNGAQRGFYTHCLFRSDGVCVVLLANDHDWFDGSALLSRTDAVASWPTTDQFPVYGLPEFPRTPQLAFAAVASLPNVTKQAYTFYGSFLDGVTSVDFGGNTLVPALSTAFEGGYVDVESPTVLHVHPPQGLVPGPYIVRAHTGAGASNPMTVQVTLSPTFDLAAQDWVLGGSMPFSVYASRGGMTTASVAALVVSTSAMPSIAPGIVSLDVGAGFTNYFLSDFLAFSPLTNVARWDFGTGLLTLPVAELQAIAVDFGSLNPWPLPTSNALTVDRL